MSAAKAKSTGLKRIKAYVLILYIGAGLAGCVTTNRQATPTSATPKNEVVAAARQLRSQEAGRTAGQGGGVSMAPLYGENTVLVIQPIAFEDLEPGMIVAYRGPDGVQIVHKLLRREGDSWVAIGINNETIDRMRVTRENLIGVVYGIFQSGTE